MKLMKSSASSLCSAQVASLILILAYNSVISSLSFISFFTPIAIEPYRGRIILIFLLAGTAFGALGGLISIGRYLRSDVGSKLNLDA